MLKLDWVAVDCADAPKLARWWANVLDYEIVYDSDEEVALEARDQSGIQVLFLKVPDRKEVKNRLHFDLRPDEQEAEVARVESLGATRVDIGQGEVTWVVLADPEGNEFCILRALTEEEKAEQQASRAG